jgi:hypothetical protein
LKKTLIIFGGIILMFLVSCSKDIENEEQILKVQQYMGNENNAFIEIHTKERVQQVKDIVANIDWENAQVSMVRPPDYRFGFQYKNPNIEAKTVLYELWISPDKDKVELVIDAESKYAQLDKKNSAILYELITKEKLSDLK